MQKDMYEQWVKSERDYFAHQQRQEKHDAIHSPMHYTQAAVQLEPIDILRYAPFDLGNCLKYLLRAGYKGDKVQDLQKAQKYLEWVKESYHMNPHLYNDFINHYGLLLIKFKVFENVAFKHGYFNVIRDLQNLINKELQNGN